MSGDGTVQLNGGRLTVQTPVAETFHGTLASPGTLVVKTADGGEVVKEYPK